MSPCTGSLRNLLAPADRRRRRERHGSKFKPRLPHANRHWSRPPRCRDGRSSFVGWPAGRGWRGPTIRRLIASDFSRLAAWLRLSDRVPARIAAHAHCGSLDRRAPGFQVPSAMRRARNPWTFRCKALVVHDMADVSHVTCEGREYCRPARACICDPRTCCSNCEEGGSGGATVPVVSHVVSTAARWDSCVKRCTSRRLDDN
jgi:hypothetical protein